MARKPGPTADDVRPRLLAEMQRQGLTYAELSERTGIPRGNLHRLLHGKPSLTEAALAKVAEALGMIAPPSKARKA